MRTSTTRGLSLIRNVSVAKSGLNVEYQCGTRAEYPWIWLRDHEHYGEGRSGVTRQRESSVFSLEPSAADQPALSADLRDGGAAVLLRWHDFDGSVADIRFSAEFLYRLNRDGGLVHARMAKDKQRVWNAETFGISVGMSESEVISKLPQTAAKDLMGSDEAVLQHLLKVQDYGFALAVDVEPTLEATKSLLERFSYIRKTSFGEFWSFSANLEKLDTAYTNQTILPHHDSTYCHDAPGLESFHVIDFQGTGALSTLSDGFYLAQQLQEAEPELYKLLSEVDVTGQYIDAGIHLQSTRPLLRHDRTGRLTQVSFNHHDRAPLLLNDRGIMRRYYEALRQFHRLATDTSCQVQFVLRPGFMVTFDNWRVLHGRGSYSGSRTLAGGYHNREDFESRIRCLLEQYPLAEN